MPLEPILEIRNLSVRAGGKTRVSDVSLSCQAGEILGLLGPNGAGKTTVLRTLYHAVRPSAGEIRLKGRLQQDWSRADWSRTLGALVQGSGLLTGLTPQDIVGIGLRPLGLARMDQQRRTEEALSLAGLTEKAEQNAESLSGGELQRCYFAQLLARDPEVYVLDEPTNHLDLHYQLVLLDEVKRRGRTALITLHDLPVAKRYCDRIAMMQSGTVSRSGAAADMLSGAVISSVYQVDAGFSGQAFSIEGPLLRPQPAQMLRSG